ncbi:hypothetical protein [Shewanella surugensis]|uniref:Uncharacterized protein n=1 Tax=Shewanella surugensis TaxID=212020 RepID=A0ABT0LGB8_9GAMM|nr:hypothetical protein [Shewanella surugensis]MCL1126415.1 hypothetical protein [Shewanella surugensis]
MSPILSQYSLNINTMITATILLSGLFFSSTSLANSDKASVKKTANVYETYGVHNSLGCNKKNHFCLSPRSRNAPSNPILPLEWISDWVMFRVKKDYKDNPPPYTNPPSTLKPEDYTISYGTSFYDANYLPLHGDGVGAMMVHYDKYCLPIFPIANNLYTCSFISLGNKTYFLTYRHDRPAHMPACCLFSPNHHPQRPDFVKHLNYDFLRSKQLNHSVLAYSREQLTLHGQVLFGFAFNKATSPDAFNTPGYQHPHSFFFSGDFNTAKAPIVSQNYTSFRTEKPNPEQTWERVSRMCPATPKPCQLFNYSTISEKNNNKFKPIPVGSGWDKIKSENN